MCNSKTVLTVVLLSFAFSTPAFLTSCTSTATQESTGQYMDSSGITTKVKTALLADKYVSSLPIHVWTFKNKVYLSGVVDSYDQKHRAVYVTQRVGGVKAVVDNLVVHKK